MNGIERSIENLLRIISSLETNGLVGQPIEYLLYNFKAKKPRGASINAERLATNPHIVVFSPRITHPVRFWVCWIQSKVS